MKLAEGPGGDIYFGGASSSTDFPALAADSELPENRSDPLFGAVDATLEQPLFARYLPTPWGGCVNAIALLRSGPHVASSAGTDCDGEATFGVRSAVVVAAGLDGAVRESYPIALDSTANGFAPADDGFIVAGGRWLGPSTIPSEPSGLEKGSIGVFVLGIVDNSAPPAAPSVTAVVDAAAFTGGPLAPGLIASVFGSSLGPQQGTELKLVDGKLPSQAGGATVLIDGRPSPMLFAQEGQINFIASFTLEPRTMAKLEIENDSGRSAPWFLPVSESHPALFTTEGLGRGFLVALNQDGALNAQDNPASAGTIVSAFGVGAGAMSPAFEDGAIAAPALPLPAPELDITVTVDGTPAEILYAGAAPGLAAGVFQINFRLPQSVGLPRMLSVQLQVGEKRFGQAGHLLLWVSPAAP